MDNSLYEQMLQQQSWLNMLETEREPEAEAANDGEQHDAGSGDRRRRCGGPGWRCGAGASAGGGFGGGGAFGPFQMFMGASPFGMPPHGPEGGHHGGRGGRGGRGCHGRHGHHHGRHGGRHGHFGPPPFGPPPFGPPHGPPHGPPPPFGPRPPHCHDEVPRVDVLKEEQQFTLIADLPGFTKKDVDVKIADNKLTIKGKLPGRNAAEAEEVIGERHAFTSFDRTFRLWDDIDASKITAKLEHGVLRIVMPRKEGAKPQDIPVDSSDDEYVAVDEGDNGGPSTA